MYLANFYRQKGDKDKTPRKKSNIGRNLAIAGVVGAGLIGGGLAVKKKLQRVAKTTASKQINLANVADEVPYYQTRKHIPTNENIKDFATRRNADHKDFTKAANQHLQNVVYNAAKKGSPEIQTIENKIDEILKTPLSELLEKAEKNSKLRWKNKNKVNISQIQKRLPPLEATGLAFKSNLFLIEFSNAR